MQLYPSYLCCFISKSFLKIKSAQLNAAPEAGILGGPEGVGANVCFSYIFAQFLYFCDLINGFCQSVLYFCIL